MTKKLVVPAVLLAVLALAPLARATTPGSPSVVTSSVSVAGVQLIPAPAANSTTIIKAVRMCNDTSVATCVMLEDGSTIKFPLCAAAQACTDGAHDAAGGATTSVNRGGLPNFLGQDLAVTNAFNVLGSTPAAQGLGGITVEASYWTQALH